MAEAAERDAAETRNQLGALREEVMALVRTMEHKGKPGLSAKDLKPEKFASKDGGKQSYRQWVDDMTT